MWDFLAFPQIALQFNTECPLCFALSTRISQKLPSHFAWRVILGTQVKQSRANASDFILHNIRSDQTEFTPSQRAGWFHSIVFSFVFYPSFKRRVCIRLVIQLLPGTKARECDISLSLTCACNDHCRCNSTFNAE